jgi:hypothetical protein
MDYIRRITIRNCGLSVADVRAAANKAEGKNAPLLRVAGYTSEAMQGQTDKGEFTRLLGEFQAVNILTGQAFSSGQCILPSFVADQLAAALRVSNEVEFAIEIGVQSDDTALTGFVYTARPLLQPSTDSRLSKLLARAGMAAALPAPEAAEPSKARKAKAEPA